MKNLQYFENFKLRLEKSPDKLEELQKEFWDEAIGVMYHIIDEVDDYKVEWSLEDSIPFWGRFLFKTEMKNILSTYKLICETCRLYEASTDFKYEVSLMIRNDLYYTGQPSILLRPSSFSSNKPFDYNWSINDFIRKSLTGKDDKLINHLNNLFQYWDKLSPWDKPTLTWTFDVISN